MSDSLDPDLAPGTDEEQVRQLLAAARHTEPIPEDVAARIDAALVGLTLEPAEDGDAPEEVPDLATVRRRRTARNLLVAAAAVVAVGIGLGQLDLNLTSDDSADSGSSTADSAFESAGSTPKQEGADADAGAGAAAVGRVVNLDPDRFGRQVRRLAVTADARVDSMLGRQSPSDNADGDSGSGKEAPAPQAYSLALSCNDTAWGPGVRLNVRYDKEPGVLIFRPKQGQTQVVDLYLCSRPASEEAPNDDSAASATSGRIAPVRSITLSGS